MGRRPNSKATAEQILLAKRELRRLRLASDVSIRELAHLTHQSVRAVEHHFDDRSPTCPRRTVMNQYLEKLEAPEAAKRSILGWLYGGATQTSDGAFDIAAARLAGWPWVRRAIEERDFLQLRRVRLLDELPSLALVSPAPPAAVAERFAAYFELARSRGAVVRERSTERDRLPGSRVLYRCEAWQENSYWRGMLAQKPDVHRIFLSSLTLTRDLDDVPAFESGTVGIIEFGRTRDPGASVLQRALWAISGTERMSRHALEAIVETLSLWMLMLDEYTVVALVDAHSAEITRLSLVNAIRDAQSTTAGTRSASRPPTKDRLVLPW